MVTTLANVIYVEAIYAFNEIVSQRKLEMTQALQGVILGEISFTISQIRSGKTYKTTT